MPKRASERHANGPDSPLAFGNCASAGRRTSSRCNSEVFDARSDSLCFISRPTKPGVSVGTTNPRMPSSDRAHTIATSATEPLVIHIFEPLRIQSEPSRRAVVRIPDGLEPKSGSVSPKQPITSPVAIRGSHCSRCSSLPCAWMANMASDPCTDTMLRRPLSTASSSWQATPYAVADEPPQP